MSMELYDAWCKRDPEWETRYQEIINLFSDYGKGTNQYQDIRGKIFGAGYEVFIIAFFIGLYKKGKKPLIKDTSKIKRFGYPIGNWGSQESRNGRTQYSRLREYIFAALVAKTDIDYIALDKGEITTRKAVDALMTQMEEYANYGFDYIQEKLEDDPNYFFKETAFIHEFISLINPDNGNDDDGEGEDPDPLD